VAGANGQSGTKQRPSAADTPRKKPAAAGAAEVAEETAAATGVDGDEYDPTSPTKNLQLAVELCGGDKDLAMKALTLSQTDKHRWKDTLDNVETSTELTREWAALGERGHDRNKK
jgi:hypothetical protein